MWRPDGRTLATVGEDKTVRLWDTTTHEQIGSPLTGHTESVNAVAFSLDGRTLATAGDDNTVRLWDTTTRKQIGTPLAGHTNRVRNVAFSPDGRTLATASEDKTVRLWAPAAHDEDLVKATCAISARPLTRIEWEQYIPELDFQQVCH